YPEITFDMRSKSFWKRSTIRAKLLGFPTSIALLIVCSDGRGLKFLDARYCGTTSLMFVDAINFDTGNPIFIASKPPVRFPKFPLGTEKTIGFPLRDRRE